MSETANSNTPVILGALAIGGYLLYKRVVVPNVVVPVQTKKFIKRLRVNVPSVRFKGDDVEFDMYIQNPNNTDITVKAIVGDVFVMGAKEKKPIKLGNINRYGSTTIRRISETKFTFKVRTKFLNLISYFSQMFNGKLTGQVFSFIGTINIDGRPYPVNQSYRIG